MDESIEPFKEMTAEEAAAPLYNINNCVSDDGNKFRPATETELKQLQQQNKIKAIKAMNLPIDNYMDNAERFYDVQPYFYDKSGLFWFWQDDLHKYSAVDDIDVMNSFDDTLGYNGQTVNAKLKNNTLEAMKRFGRGKVPKSSKTKWVQFKDKAYSLNSGNIYEVTPDYFFTNPIPWELGKTTDTPVMDKLIIEWVGEKYKDTIYEMIAYCCYTDYPIQVIFCLFGSGRNGKSQLIKLLRKFIGKDNICSTELDTLVDNRFESFKLYKKLVCSMGETNFGVMSKTSLLKKLVGGDLIGFEVKNKTPFDDVNYAKIIIASNSLPVSEDTSDGFYRRWIIIDFPNSFQEGTDIISTIPEIEYNNLAKKIVEILPTLLKKGTFTNQGSIEERQKKYIMASNPLPLFIEECCVKDESAYISYGELYTAFVKYLLAHKKRKVKKGEFKSSLEIEGFWIDRTSKQSGENWQNGLWITGLRLKNDKELSESVNFVKNMNSFCTLTTPTRNGVENVTQNSQISHSDGEKNEIREFILSHPKDNAVVIDEKYGLNVVIKLLEDGFMYEAPKGTYQLIDAKEFYL